MLATNFLKLYIGDDNLDTIITKIPNNSQAILNDKK